MSHVVFKGWVWFTVGQRCRLFALIAALLLLIGAPAPAKAVGTCSITMNNLAFGAIDVTLGAAVDVATSMSVTCSGFGSDPPRLCISLDAGSAGDSTSRLMSTGTLRYDLFTDFGRTQLWGSWETGYRTKGAGFTGLDGTVSMNVFGRVFASQQTVAPGSYSSTFTLNPVLRYGRTSGSSPCPGPLTEQQIVGATSSVTVTATVNTACQVSTTSLNFGSTPALGANIDGSSTVSTLCTNGTPYTVGLDAGTGSGATVATRKMTHGGNTIDYSLYRNGARTQVWGTTVGSNTASSTGSGVSQPLTVYGRIPVQTTPPTGTYNDSITATVTY